VLVAVYCSVLQSVAMCCSVLLLGASVAEHLDARVAARACVAMLVASHGENPRQLQHQLQHNRVDFVQKLAR